MLQLVLSIVVSVFALVYHVYAMPFTEHWLNLLQGACLFFIWLTLQAGLMVSPTEPNSSAGNVLLIALAAANVVVVVSPFLMAGLAVMQVLPASLRRRVSTFLGMTGDPDADAPENGGEGKGDDPASPPPGSVDLVQLASPPSSHASAEAAALMDGAPMEAPGSASMQEFQHDRILYVPNSTGQALALSTGSAVSVSAVAMEPDAPDISLPAVLPVLTHPTMAPSTGVEFFDPSVVNEDALPPGWLECTDDSGDVYYFNVETSESLWERPAALPAATGDPPPLPPAIGHPHLNSVTVNPLHHVTHVEARGGVSEVDHDAVVEPESLQLADSPDHEPALPSGWDEYVDDAGDVYFHHRETGATQWQRPGVDDNDEVTVSPDSPA
jgi:hypothetical protein